MTRERGGRDVMTRRLCRNCQFSGKTEKKIAPRTSTKTKTKLPLQVLFGDRDFRGKGGGNWWPFDLVMDDWSPSDTIGSESNNL